MFTIMIKQADESRNTTTTLTDDGELTVALDAGTTYFIDIMVIADSGATPDFKYAYVYTGTLTRVGLTETIFDAALPSTGGSGDGFGTAWHLAGTNLTTPTVRTRQGSNTAGTTEGGNLRGIIVTNSSGNLKLQWAQSVSDAGNTTVHKGSYIAFCKQTDMDGTLLVKTGDTSRTNNTQAADPDLTFPTLANKKYVMELFQVADANSTAPDYRWGLHDPQVALTVGHTLNSMGTTAGVIDAGAGALGLMGQWFQTGWLTTPNTSLFLTSTSATKEALHILWSHQMGGSDSTAALEWAQDVTNATAAIQRAGGWMWVQEIEQA